MLSVWKMYNPTAVICEGNKKRLQILPSYGRAARGKMITSRDRDDKTEEVRLLRTKQRQRTTTTMPETAHGTTSDTY